jgi:hypothetical protein
VISFHESLKLSSDEGFSILRKMREKSSKICVHFLAHGREERFASSVQAITKEVLIVSKYTVGLFAVNLEDVIFACEDSREARPGYAGNMLETLLELSWPNGARCRLALLC